MTCDQICEASTPVLFADDTSIIISEPDEILHMELSNYTLVVISKWFLAYSKFWQNKLHKIYK